MTEENPDLTFPANLTSMYDKEFFELVWENGQLLKRDLPRRGQNSPSCNGYSSNARVHVKKGGETFPSKTSRLGTRDSILGDSYHKNSYLNSLQDDNLHESWPELYQNHLNVLLEHGKGCINDKFQKDSQVVPVHEHANLKTSCSSNYIAEAPQLAPTSQPDQSSLKQYHESAPLKRLSVNSRKDLVSVSELADSKLQEKDLEADRKRDVANFSLFLRSPPLLKVKDLEADRKRDVANFSLFLRSPPLLKVNNQQSGVKVPASYPVGLPRAEELKNGGEKSSPVSTNHFNSLQPIITAHGSKPYQHNSTEAIVELLKPSAKPPFKIFQDEHSEADCHDDAFANNGSNNEVYSQTSNLEANKAKAKLITQKSKELAVPTSSLCSRRASNNPTYTLKRRYEDSEGSADHPTQNIEKKPKRTKAVPGSKENRKRRIAEIHNLSERRRRDKINKKMRALRELIPNCNKVDKTSMLDDAIEYLKALQLQVQMMSMGSRAYMPQMMLPTGIQEISIHVPHVSHFSPMPMRMQMGMGCNPANLLIPPNPGASVVPGPGMPMFPAQLLPTSVLHAAPLGLGLGLSNRAHQIPGVSLISATMELVDPATRSNSRNNTNAE